MDPPHAVHEAVVKAMRANAQLEAVQFGGCSLLAGLTFHGTSVQCGDGTRAVPRAVAMWRCEGRSKGRSEGRRQGYRQGSGDVAMW